MPRLLLLLLLLVPGWVRGFDARLLREGDLIFQETSGAQAVALEAATGSRWTHVGLYLLHAGRPSVLEAVGPVRYTPLREFLAGSRNGKYAVLRLREAGRLLPPAGIRRLRRAVEHYLGREYDSWFRWDDRRMYCSELVWKLFSRELGIRIGDLRRFGSFTLTAPPVRELVRQRFGGRVPLDETVIAPGDMAASPLLRLVYLAP